MRAPIQIYSDSTRQFFGDQQATLYHLKCVTCFVILASEKPPSATTFTFVTPTTWCAILRLDCQQIRQKHLQIYRSFQAYLLPAVFTEKHIVKTPVQTSDRNRAWWELKASARDLADRAHREWLTSRDQVQKMNLFNVQLTARLKTNKNYYYSFRLLPVNNRRRLIIWIHRTLLLIN